MNRVGNKSRTLDRVAEVTLLAVCFALYAWWACNLPQNMAPDEEMRFLVPQFIYENGYLPLGSDSAIRSKVWGTSYGFSVYGSSLLAVVLMKIAGLFGATGSSLIVAARFSSVVFSVGTVFLCLRIGARLFPNYRPGKYMLALFVGLLPQFVFISSYFNSDAIEVFCIALIILCWLRGIESRWRWGDCVFLGLALGLCALSYYYAYGGILASIFVFYASMHAVRKKDKVQAGSAAVSYAGKPVLILLVALTVAGWFFVRNAILYDGDFLGMPTSTATAEIYAPEGLKPSDRLTARADGMSIADMMLGIHSSGLNWSTSTIKSFIGMFGYMNIPLGGTTYLAYFSVIGVGLVTSLLFLVFRFKHASAQEKTFIVGQVVMIVIPCVLSIYYSWASDFQPQGRYLFAALISIMIAMTSGYVGLASVIDSRRFNAGKHLVKRRTVRGVLAETALPCLLMALWIFLFVWVFLTRITVFCVGPVL